MATIAAVQYSGWPHWRLNLRFLVQGANNHWKWNLRRRERRSALRGEFAHFLAFCNLSHGDSGHSDTTNFTFSARDIGRYAERLPRASSRNWHSAHAQLVHAHDFLPWTFGDSRIHCLRAVPRICNMTSLSVTVFVAHALYFAAMWVPACA